MSSDQRELLTVCLNPAWQKTLVFPRLTLGAVNRAEQLREAGGGKGINAARALRKVGAPVAVALFSGGHTGGLLLQELRAAGVRVLAAEVDPPTRTCTTLVDLATATVTELIEPSGEASPAAVGDLLAKVIEALPRVAGAAICGTAPPGVPDTVYGEIAAAARRRGVPVLLDTVKAVGPALAAGIDVLKVNAAELRGLTGLAGIPAAARLCLEQHRVRWVGVTDGPGVAWLVGPGTTLRYELPRLDGVRSTIGAGDCASGILLERIAATGLEATAMPAAFADALAAASASCLTDIPALFDPAQAARLRQRLTWRALPDT
jgi:tagatose 6-phosphate kinase